MDFVLIDPSLSSLIGGLVSKCAMWPAIVVEVAPLFDEDSSFLEVSEPFTVQAFVPQLAVEALDVSIFPRAAAT